MKWLFIHDGRGPPDYPGVLDPDAKLHFGVEWRDYFGSDDPPQSITWDGGGLLAENELFYVTATINGENYKT